MSSRTLNDALSDYIAATELPSDSRLFDSRVPVSKHSAVVPRIGGVIACADRRECKEIMATAPPARIAILGAGPIGIEAALYARALGYTVRVYERGGVAENVLQWGHVRLFSPARMNCSPLGLAALEAQDPGYQRPDPETIWNAGEWVRDYLSPLSRTDLLSDTIEQNTSVLRVGRCDLLKSDLPGNPQRGSSEFRILVECPDGPQRIDSADVVIDCTGVFGNANWIGQGGIPAVGETAVRARIEFGIPDLRGRERERYLDRRTLVIGRGYSAATNVMALQQLIRETDNTSVVWVTRRSRSSSPPEPGSAIPLIPNDRLDERDRLARAANRLIRGPGTSFKYYTDSAIRAITYEPGSDQFRVAVSGDLQGEFMFDRIIANVGWRPDRSIYDELQIHLCYATEGPMKLAARLLGQTSADCLDQASGGPDSLLNPEPDFFVLGAKSYGRNSKFLISLGLEQIRDLFGWLIGREGLDLYSSAKQLAP